MGNNCIGDGQTYNWTLYQYRLEQGERRLCQFETDARWFVYALRGKRLQHRGPHCWGRSSQPHHAPGVCASPTVTLGLKLMRA